MKPFPYLQPIALAMVLPLFLTVTCTAQQRAVPITNLAHLSVVPVHINGEGPFDFVLDTGAGINVLNVDLVAKLGIEPVGTMEIGSPMGAAPIVADSLRIESIQFGSAVVKGLPGVAMELNELFGSLGAPDGILAAGSFDGYLVTVDFANGYSLVAEGALDPADGKRILDYSPDDRVPQIEVSIAGEPVRVAIDSGARAGLLLSDSLVATLPLLSEPVSAGQARVVDATFEIMSSQLDGSMLIGDFEFENPRFTYSDHAGHALLGMGFLKDFVLTIDSANRRLLFAKPEKVRRVEVSQSPTPSAEPRIESGEAGLAEYVGQFGPRNVTLVNSVLRYQRDGMPSSVAMKAIGDDEFELMIPAGAQVRGAVDGRFPTLRFNRSSSGDVESFSVVNPDGSIAGTSPKK